MNISSQLLFFFSAIGVFNALILSGFFFFKKPRTQSNMFFGFLLLMLTIRIGKSVIFYFDNDVSRTFLQVGISACLMIGPSLFFYVLSIVSPDSKIIKQWIFHFAILAVGMLTFGLIYPWNAYPYMWYDVVYWIYWIWFSYIIASGWTIRNSFKTLFNKEQKLSGIDFWLISVFIGNALIWSVFKFINFSSYIAGALSFSFIFFLLIVLFFFNKRKISIFGTNTKYSNKIEEGEASQLANQLEELMKTDLLFKDANLKLQDVASKMRILPHRLSQLLNDNLDQSFTHYINACRIELSKQMIQTDHHLSLESIGYACGFNSKSTFYTAFKKQTGTTPAQFKGSL